MTVAGAQPLHVCLVCGVVLYGVVFPKQLLHVCLVVSPYGHRHWHSSLLPNDGITLMFSCACGHCFIGTDGVADSVIEALTLGAEL